MPLVSIRLVAGRSDEELRRLVAGVSNAVSDSLDVPLERVNVHIFELPESRIGRGGQLACDVEADE